MSPVEAGMEDCESELLHKVVRWLEINDMEVVKVKEILKSFSTLKETRKPYKALTLDGRFARILLGKWTNI